MPARWHCVVDKAVKELCLQLILAKQGELLASCQSRFNSNSLARLGEPSLVLACQMELSLSFRDCSDRIRKYFRIVNGYDLRAEKCGPREDTYPISGAASLPQATHASSGVRQLRPPVCLGPGCLSSIHCITFLRALNSLTQCSSISTSF